MKKIQKWSSICLPTLLIAGAVVVGWMVVQPASAAPPEAQVQRGKLEIRKLPASLTPPPDVQELEMLQTRKLPEPPGNRPTMGELEQKILSQPGGRERFQKAKSRVKDKPMQPSASPPPDVQELEILQIHQPPQPPGMRPTREEMEQRINTLPGGKELLQRAKGRERPTGMRGDWPEDLLSWLNPLSVTEVEAQGATFSLTLSHTMNADRNRFNLSSTSPVGMFYFQGASVSATEPGNSFSSLIKTQYSWGDGTTQTIQPLAQLGVVVPTEGWYIVSVYANTPGSVSLRHYEGGQSPVLFTWNMGPGWNPYSYPVYLAAGKHYFYWTFSTYAYVESATVWSIP